MCRMTADARKSIFLSSGIYNQKNHHGSDSVLGLQSVLATHANNLRTSQLCFAQNHVKFFLFPHTAMILHKQLPYLAIWSILKKRGRGRDLVLPTKKFLCHYFSSFSHTHSLSKDTFQPFQLFSLLITKSFFFFLYKKQHYILPFVWPVLAVSIWTLWCLK